jgi:hypothetical protein
MNTSFQADDVNPPGQKNEADMTYKVHGGRLYDKQFTLVKVVADCSRGNITSVVEGLCPVLIISEARSIRST